MLYIITGMQATICCNLPVSVDRVFKSFFFPLIKLIPEPITEATCVLSLRSPGESKTVYCIATHPYNFLLISLSIYTLPTHMQLSCQPINCYQILQIQAKSFSDLDV